MVFKVLDRPNKGAEQFKCTAAPALAGGRCTGKFAPVQKVLRVNGPHCVRKPVAADIKKDSEEKEEKEKSLTMRVQVSRLSLVEIYSSSRSSTSTFFLSFCSFLTPLKLLFCCFGDE